ncbi:hypothetical protein Nmel_000942, partial [Mimus melanotis]
MCLHHILLLSRLSPALCCPECPWLVSLVLANKDRLVGNGDG